MNFRHEWKHEINYSDFISVRRRLEATAKPDSHGTDGCYSIRSLYFDNLSDKALMEKIDGVDLREKFRIRYYNRDASYICLEKKSKVRGLCRKETLQLSEEEVKQLLEGDYAWMKMPEKKLAGELYSKMMSQGLRPKTIVEYDRKAYIYEPGNVRVTLDYHIRTGILSTKFLDPYCVTVPVRFSPIIMEVKWDAFLPGIIQDAVQLEGRCAAAFSKYTACRVYG